MTNTNEVGRSAILHAGFRACAAAFGAPLDLVEIGPSAGLNLIWDDYGVRYMREGQEVGAIGGDAPLILQCEFRGNAIPPSGPTPKVARRIGLELNPVDIESAEDVDWLRALIWPGQADRRAQFERALAMLRSRKPEIRAGDAMDLILDALAEAPNTHHLCVFHTIAVYQFSTAMKQALQDTLVAASLRRPLSRLSLEYRDVEAELVLTRYDGGTVEERLLAVSHPHGRWLEWRE
ncbi:MAG: DUF2332 domain-containing protein [Alphaproteobacteria bacterium]|nr:DUF2332 domain-containing protein [Alphaproteobacteria bacterium]